MSLEQQNENTHDIEESSVQEEELKPLHPIVCGILWTFIALNASLIFLAIIPAIFSIPFLRYISIPTPWLFHEGYGTPLGLPLDLAILMSVLFGLLIIFSLCILIKRVRAEVKVLSCVFITMILITCFMVMRNAGENIHEYLRGALELPDGVGFRVGHPVLFGG